MCVGSTTIYYIFMGYLKNTLTVDVKPIYAEAADIPLQPI